MKMAYCEFQSLRLAKKFAYYGEPSFELVRCGCKVDDGGDVCG